MVGIKKYAMEINSSFLMFLHTNNEFCINDLGYATERTPVSISEYEKADCIQQAKEIGIISASSVSFFGNVCVYRGFSGDKKCTLHFAACIWFVGQFRYCFKTRK